MVRTVKLFNNEAIWKHAMVMLHNMHIMGPVALCPLLGDFYSGASSFHIQVTAADLASFGHAMAW